MLWPSFDLDPATRALFLAFLLLIRKRYPTV